MMKKASSRYILPAILGAALLMAILPGKAAPGALALPAWQAAPDTVTYPVAAYKLARRGNLEAYTIADSLLHQGPDSLDFGSDAADSLDSLPRLTARDTIKVPDSLRETDPFLYKYYVATIDSLTHRIVCDSLNLSGRTYMDSSKVHFDQALTGADSLAARADSLMAESEWLDMRRVDTLYLRDSTAKAKAAFLAWYNSLDKDARKKYDYEQKEKRKMEVRDSLQEIKDDKKAVRDSIREATPRVLETYCVPDSMQYKRIFAWNPDRDFLDVEPFIPDSSANYHFHDYAFLRKDVNATWLGVAGSPVQYYNYFNRTSISGVEFWEPNEAWTCSPSTMMQYNTKTPHTELAYWGTLFTGSAKSSDNIRILTTQNITPAMNFSILYERWGGNGILANESVKNKTFAAGWNYLGKRYSADFGFIHNNVERGENGGIWDESKTDNYWIRDTTVDSREVPVRYQYAASHAKKATVYGDQQLRIPFNFINDLRAKRDSTFVPDSTADVTTAFIGHSIEYSRYQREFLFDGKNPQDSLGQTRLDNKIYIRLQPWGSESIVSKLDVGVGDYLQKYNYNYVDGHKDIKENSLYAYAGARGQFRNYMDWNARAHMVFAGADAGNSDISGRIAAHFYPFRKARTSPLTLEARASTSLLKPTFSQRYSYTTNYKWDKDFSMISTTKLEGVIDVPYWKLNARVGYALLDGNLYYGTDGIIAQNTSAMSVLSASLRKDFSIGNFLFLENRILAQVSSNQEVLPLPALAANLRWYIQFPVEPGVMDMQIGADMWCNTAWYSPEWNPELGVFHNQTESKYNNGPYFDAFINMQWKMVCIFVKFQNVGEGWPLDRPDYFSAHRQIITTGRVQSLKLGVWWPFYTSPIRNRKVGSV
ncbi:MAG: putative porin [Bacteroidales bacterium]|nr:putative porin [Candidatus Cryptobacteroides aphodequi]